MTDVMAMLRDGTAEQHRTAEHQEFQQRMFRASIRRDEYVAWLEQMWLVHRALEAGLGARRKVDSRFAAVLDEHAKVPLLAADLAALGADSEPQPLPATRELLARIDSAAQADPLRLLGFQYVLEGSTNGNRILARRLLPALGLDRGDAGRYLDPYRGRQREVWARFKQDMGAIELGAEERDLLVDAAREMFAGLAEVSADLARLSSAPQTSAG